MPRELINPPELHPTPGFSHIAVPTGARLVFVAGQVALDRDFNVVGDSLAAQTKAAMENVGTALSAIGASFEDVVRRTIYTTQPNEWETIALAVEEVQGSDRNPPQTIVGVPALALPELLIEIECTVSID
jgi:enamine deaminase RidA (YjgF/YER057c/UK114 family)